VYSLSYLPVAKRDITDIANYIAETLAAPQAALELLEALDVSITRLRDFPYSCRVYQPVKPLEREYRILTVNNYAVFYTVSESDQMVEICRVIYGKRDMDRLI